jgi:hypothetical protein
MLFSQRLGITPTGKLAQRESIDDDLKNSLWNAVLVCYLERVRFTGNYGSTKGSNLSDLFHLLWLHHFKKPVDTIPHSFYDAQKTLRDYFFTCKWHEALDLLESISKFGPRQQKPDFIDICNSYLTRENSAYRFVNEQLSEITSKEEIDSVEQASSSKFDPVNQHLRAALTLLNDREKPNYRNSIKESISAVEAISKILTKDPKATLGQALKILENDKNLHSAMKSAFSSLYGYTSDAEGIRHALLEEPTLTKRDAKFMLVSCSAFINYLIELCDSK